MSVMTDDGGGDRDYIKSIERGFTVLLAFDAERPRPTMSDIAAATGLSRPAVRRILLTLQRLGYVAALDDGRWALTPAVLSIGQHYTETHALVETAQPHLLRLAEHTQESASLAALYGTEVVYIGRIPVRRIMSINVSVGTRVSAHATSMGRALLAWAPAAQVQRVIDAGLTRHTPHTVTDPGRLREELRTVREQGWALVADELEDGLVSVAAPVRDATGEVVAALASSTSSGRTTTERLTSEVVPLLLKTAEAISADLGHRARARRAAAVTEGFY